MHLRGTTGKQLVLQGAVQPCLDEEFEKYFKKIEKYVIRNQERTDKKILLQIGENEGITRVENVRVYEELCRKQRDTIYKYRPNNKCEELMNMKEKFERLSCEEQCTILNEIMWLLRCKPNAANLSLLGGAPQSGVIKINKMLVKCQSVKLKYQSVTGLFEQTVDLLKI